MKPAFSLSGCGTALVTPFKSSGCIDWDAFERLVERQIAAGIHFLVPLGTTGETPTLTDAEKVELLGRTVALARGRVPVVAGVGSNSTAHTLHTIDLLKDLGAQAFLVVVPYYNKPTQEGMFRHFTALADHSPLPLVLYNVPGRTGSNITAATTLRLAAHPNIVAMKEASGNYAQINELIGKAPEDFTVLSGNDDETLSLMATGARGIISVASNVAPAQVSALAQALLDNQLPTARTLHHRLSPLFRHCFVESNPLPVKAALHALGLIDNVLRLPLCPATEQTCALMEQTLKDLGLL